MTVGCLQVCVIGSWRSQKRASEILELKLQTGKVLCVFWEVSLGPLEEQWTFLHTEPSLQHQICKR